MSRLTLALVVVTLLLASAGNLFATGTVIIGDTVWVNYDGDSIKDAGEPGIPGATLTLWLLNGTTWQIVGTATTDANGLYKFIGLIPGYDWKVSVTLPPAYVGYTQNYDRDGVLDGQSNGVVVVNDLTYDFGYIPPPWDGGETYTQGGWGAKPSGNNPGTVLHTNWNTVYATMGLTLVIGGGYTLTFTGPQAVTDFLPAGGTPDVLSESSVNPVGETSAGVFAGQVLALKLNVDFSAAGVIAEGLGGLKIQSGTYQGWTVAQLLGLAQAVLGGDTSGLLGSVADLSDACTAVNENFCDEADNGFLAP